MKSTHINLKRAATPNGEIRALKISPDEYQVCIVTWTKHGHDAVEKFIRREHKAFKYLESL